ncbi:hypothetical protein HYH02_013027 [Chlamydomonas schloesseri]|uniref:Transmembrane protein n=1 Tax=Chlamydomonas schloesseri TaxID=2026947 RepID=A0A835T5Z6_9CHLO|nr:hypothetical protein HYH02_013027 [Chlamydomonas schloesseri]|eukprot:KAG2432305.1 hypothetical protein HYH02_013027 [Chlamydomonas schloesseri]
MPCPFGFTAEDGEYDLGDITSSEEEEEEKVEEGAGSGNEKQKKSKKDKKKAKEDEDVEEIKPSGAKKKKEKKKAPEELEFDFEKDPVSWFYQNQIKSEAEFAKKKDALRAEARKRLDAIMSKKDKHLEWPSDSDLDDLSIRSSELSDLDSDVDSLASIISCANSWIEDARYGTPAEKTLTWTAYTALATSGYSLWLTVQAVNTTRKVIGVLANSVWPNAAFGGAALLGASFIGLLMAVRYRSKRILLLSQAACLFLYSAFLVITCGVVFQPTVVDAKLRDVACVKYSNTDQGSRLCKMIPGIERDLAEQMYSLMWAAGLAAITAMASLIASIWYLYELSYIEKKAIKHKRRHKRRKHSIPWEKIKIVGPVTNCGANKPAGGATGGKCPIDHGGAASAGKCPVGFGGGGDKKTN